MQGKGETEEGKGAGEVGIYNHLSSKRISRKFYKRLLACLKLAQSGLHHFCTER